MLRRHYAAQIGYARTRKRDLSQALKICQQGGAPNGCVWRSPVRAVRRGRCNTTRPRAWWRASSSGDCHPQRRGCKAAGQCLYRRPQRRWARCWHLPASPPAAKSSGGWTAADGIQPRAFYMAAKTAAMLQEGDLARSTTPLFEDEEEKNGEEKRPPARITRARRSISVPGGGGTPVSTCLGVMAIPLLRFFL